MHTSRLAAIGLALAVAIPLAAVTGQDDTPSKTPPATLEAIRATALDYVDGWYTGDADRMQRAVHPQLAKRIAMTRQDASPTKLESMSADQLVAATGRGGGATTPEPERLRRIEVLDVTGNAATVKATMRDWVDYMHVARVDDRWVIVNVLWEFRPAVKQKMGLK